MRIIYPNRDATGEWLAGPWNSPLAFAIAFRRAPVEEPHYHKQAREICVVTAGRAELMVGGHVRPIETGAVVLIEAGEIHAWRGANRDFQMLVLHDPHAPNDTFVVVEV